MALHAKHGFLLYTMLAAALAAGSPVRAAEVPPVTDQRVTDQHSGALDEIRASARRVEEKLHAAIAKSENALQAGLPSYFGAVDLGPEFVMSSSLGRLWVNPDLARKYSNTSWLTASNTSFTNADFSQDNSNCDAGFGAMIAPMSSCDGQAYHIHSGGHGHHVPRSPMSHFVPDRVTLFRLHW